MSSAVEFERFHPGMLLDASCELVWLEISPFGTGNMGGFWVTTLPCGDPEIIRLLDPPLSHKQIYLMHTKKLWMSVCEKSHTVNGLAPWWSLVLSSPIKTNTPRLCPFGMIHMLFTDGLNFGGWSIRYRTLYHWHWGEYAVLWCNLMQSDEIWCNHGVYATYHTTNLRKFT